MLTTHGEQPDSSRVPPEWKDAVLHARIEIGGTTIFGADIPPERSSDGVDPTGMMRAWLEPGKMLE